MQCRTIKQRIVSVGAAAAQRASQRCEFAIDARGTLWRGKENMVGVKKEEKIKIEK